MQQVVLAAIDAYVRQPISPPQRPEAVEVTELQDAFAGLQPTATSGEATAGRDPATGLAGDRGNVLEISVVMKDDSTMVLGYGRGDQVDDTCCPVMPASRHPDLDIPGPLSNYSAHRQDNIETSAALRDSPDVGQVATGITSFQVDGDTGRSGAVHNEPRYDPAYRGVPVSGLCRGVDQV